MTIIQNQIVNVLLTKGVEFVAIAEYKLEAFHDRKILSFNELPNFAYDTIKKLMGGNPTKKEMEVFAFNRWGGFDDVVDIAECGMPSDPEFVQGYSKSYHSNGISISEAQLRVLINIPTEDKIIADKLCLSKHTVARHCNVLYSQLDGNNRTEIAISATKKGII